jgi:uncharacterized protein (DUF58 family)
MFWKLSVKPRAKAKQPPMWKTFLQSLAFLTVALMFALYSSTAAHAGNMPATLITALTSVVLALWVGIRFVPRLARDVDWTWMPGFGQYKVTREGGIFLVALLIVLSAAVNTSNNLLYIVLSSLLALLVLSALLSHKNFKYLEMELLLPPHVFVGESMPVSIRIRNHRRVFPAFSLLTEPPGQSLYFPVIQPQVTVQRLSEATFARRGRYSFDKLGTKSRFPFGFFLKNRDYRVSAECICYPEILPEEELDVSIRDIIGSHERPERGSGSDLHMIRDYVPSDSARHVDWKATAKTAALKTREFAAVNSHRLLIAFDRYGNPADADPFEDLVSRAASLALHLIRNGQPVLFLSDDFDCPADASEASLDAILQYLALVEMSATAAPPQFDPERGALLLSLRRGRA